MRRYLLSALMLFAAGCKTVDVASDVESPSRNVTYDAAWRPFAAYIDRLISKVEKRWERTLIDSRQYPAFGTVKVTFTVDAQGKVVEILRVANGSSEYGAKVCVAAISGAAPYGKWSDEMVAALGTKQELTFTFNYQ